MPLPSGQWIASGDLTYSVYGYIGGVWTLLGTNTGYATANVSGPGQHTINMFDTITVSSTANITDFRVTRDSFNAVSANLTGAQASWTVATSSSDRSATPNGEKVTATMRPR